MSIDAILNSSLYSLFVDRSLSSRVSLYRSTCLDYLFQICDKVILFMVRVPVLSEQMLLAPPIVSQAYIFLTKFWSLSIFLTEKAREMVTDSGRP